MVSESVLYRSWDGMESSLLSWYQTTLATPLSTDLLVVNVAGLLSALGPQALQGELIVFFFNVF